MEDDQSLLPRLVIRVVYEDQPDFFEVEVRVVTEGWSAAALVYASPISLLEDARSLLEWTRHLRGNFTIESMWEAGDGSLSLRWYAIDRAGHVACHIQVTSRKHDSRPESIRRLSLELQTEPGLVENFARQLLLLAKSFDGEAVLLGV